MKDAAGLPNCLPCNASGRRGACGIRREVVKVKGIDSGASVLEPTDIVRIARDGADNRGIYNGRPKLKLGLHRSVLLALHQVRELLSIEPINGDVHSKGHNAHMAAVMLLGSEPPTGIQAYRDGNGTFEWDSCLEIGNSIY